VFGFKTGLEMTMIQLRERAKGLEAQFEKPHYIEFLSFLEKLCEHNPHNNTQFFMDKK
jgi:hypothetical protein